MSAAVLGCWLVGCGGPLSGLAEIIPTLAMLAAEPPQITYGEPFVTCGDRTLVMDVFAPRTTGDAPRPAVVLVHGGYWLSGDPWLLHDWAVDLATQGYVAVTPEYRLVSEGATYPAQVADVLAAIAHVRARAAEWNVDPDRIALMGHSAGAHLALLAGLAADASLYEPTWPAGEPAGVRAIVSLAGPTDFTVDLATAEPWQIWLVTTFLGAARENAADLWAQASPVTHARADGPPVLILHGGRDELVPAAQAQSLSDALDSAGQTHEFIFIPDADHVWGMVWISPWAQRQRPAILDFLRTYLEAPAVTAIE